MPRQPKPKLLQMVCKHAALMRAPYYSALCSVKSGQINKKTVSVNKTRGTVQPTKSNTTKFGKSTVKIPEGMYLRNILLINDSDSIFSKR
jgi:hypothetical protein